MKRDPWWPLSETDRQTVYEYRITLPTGVAAIFDMSPDNDLGEEFSVNFYPKGREAVYPHLVGNILELRCLLLALAYPEDAP